MLNILAGSALYNIDVIRLALILPPFSDHIRSHFMNGLGASVSYPISMILIKYITFESGASSLILVLLNVLHSQRSLFF